VKTMAKGIHIYNYYK